MESDMIYRDLAEYYDLLYSWKDYKRESMKLFKLVGECKKSRGRDLLELACGTGSHAKYLKKRYRVVATDVSSSMLRLARKKNPDVQFLQADMTDFDLGKEFDVILCLFSSIGYVRTIRNLRSTVRCVARHLRPGGVFIVEPWFDHRSYVLGVPRILTYGDERIKIARMAVSKAKGRVSIMDMHYLVAEHGKKVFHFVDRHELAMFERQEVLRAFKSAGLTARFHADGLMPARGLYVGSKPATRQ